MDFYHLMNAGLLFSLMALPVSVALWFLASHP